MWPAPFRRWQDAVYAGALGVVAIAFLLVEHRHDLTFPIPWPDEGSFLWAALAFRDHFTLYSPELNPEREIFWMPPGFMVLEGIIFKVWSFSLLRARFLSALFLTGALACLAVQVRTSRARYGHGILLGVFAFSPIFQLVGNTARMEGLVLLLSVLGLLFLDRRKMVGLAVLAAAPLVHPNAAFACAGGIAYWLVAFRGQRKPSRADLASFVVVAVLWLLYALHVGSHWSSFVEDMTSQMRWKQTEAALNGTMSSRLLEPLRVAVCVGLVAAFVVGLRVRARVGALFALAFPFTVGSGLTVGWLYEVYASFGAMLFAMIVLEVVATFAARRNARVAIAVLAAATALVGGGALWFSRHPFLLSSVARATMPNRSGVMYCTRAEHDLIEAFIKRSIRKDGPIVVQFLPDADSLLFADMRSPSVQLLQQTFFSTRPDVYILHDTPWFPVFLRDIELADFAMRNRVDLPLGEWGLIAKSTRAQWVAVRHDGPGQPWY